MKIRNSFLVCLLYLFIAFQGIDAQEILKTSAPNGWILKTENSVYQMIIDNNQKIKHVFYGSPEQSDFRQKNAKWMQSVDEVPVRGGVPFRTPAVEVVFSDGVRDMDLIFDFYEIIEDKGIPLLKIVQKDTFYPIEIISYFKVYKEFDIIEKWITVKNTDKRDKILIENLLSAGIVLPPAEYSLKHLSGRYMNEFQIHQAYLTAGLKTIQSKAFKSNEHAPCFMVNTAETTKSQGPVWFGSLHYSGNWGLYFDKNFDGSLQILGGINFWDTNWTLNPNEVFITPKMTFGYTCNGSDMMSVNLANYIRKHVLPSRFRDELRPVLYNSWEATNYNVNEQQQIELANVAKEIGIELFVVDDGWFKDRTDGRSRSGLGNFDLDKNKFPNGLKPLIDHVHGLGMKFGLWVEPENVNPNSDVYRAHPDWIFQFPNRKGNEFRKTLNLANESAYNHLLESLTKLLQENDIDFIKWDQNNYLSEPGWVNAPKGLEKEVRIRHTNNVYRLIEELRKRFPNVLFETCASGGGRVDLGMLSRMDQAWVSDNTDPIDRLFIQEGYNMMLPANTMVSWVTSMARHQPISLDYRFNVSMSGTLGVGANISKWTKEEKEIAKAKIVLYKKIRPTVQQGNHYSLVSPFEANRSAMQYVSQNSENSVVFCYNLANYLYGSQHIDRGTTTIKLKGLDADTDYIVKDTTKDDDKGVVYNGKFLMNVGLNWPLGNQFFQSKVLLIEQVN